MGLFDHLYISIRGRIKDKENKDSSWKKEFREKNSKNHALIFLGWRNEIKHFEKLYSRFQDNLIIYNPPNTLLSSDPLISKQSYQEIIKDIEKTLQDHKPKTTYGFSLGITLSCIASNISNDIEKLILSVPGERIAPIMWHSPITRAVVKEAKAQGHSLEDFQKALEEFDPVNNLDDLKGKDIRVFLAKKDSIVPYRHGKKLVEIMRRANLNPKVITIPFLGHFLGGLYSMHSRMDGFYSQ